MSDKLRVRRDKVRENRDEFTEKLNMRGERSRTKHRKNLM